MNHSTTPWTIERDANGELALWDSSNLHLLHSDGGLPLDERRRNAQIMRAAPFLLAACRMALAALTPSRNPEEQEAAEEIQAALDIVGQPIPGEDWRSETED